MIEEEIRTAIVEELRRQAAEGLVEAELRQDTDRLHVSGGIDLGALVMAVTGAVAGGP